MYSLSLIARCLPSLVRYSLLLVLPFCALVQIASAYTIQAENWVQWLSEKTALSRQMDAAEYGQLRMAVFNVQQDWMESHGLLVSTQDAKALDEFAQYLKGKTVAQLVERSNEIEKERTQHQLQEAQTRYAEVKQRLSEKGLPAAEHDTLEGEKMALESDIKRLKQKLK